jgi:NAD(P)-dependent dehydrogenase (short-subunit alcohol dehydrogenase family)
MALTPKQRLLVFGASGSLGAACVTLLKNEYEIHTPKRNDELMKEPEKFAGVVWAQGKNLTKPFVETSEDEWVEVFEANFNFFRKRLKELLLSDRLSKPSRLVVIGSVWSEVARADKTAYIASKSALAGLVRGLAVELGPMQIAINSVLPGPIDNEMTRKNLTSDQLNTLKSESPSGRLVTPENVANLVKFLVSKESSGVSGASIELDYGWAIGKNV